EYVRVPESQRRLLSRARQRLVATDVSPDRYRGSRSDLACRWLPARTRDGQSRGVYDVVRGNLWWRAQVHAESDGRVADVDNRQLGHAEGGNRLVSIRAWHAWPGVRD